MVAPVGDVRNPLQRFESLMLVGPVEQSFNARVDAEQRRAKIGKKRLQLLRVFPVRSALKDSLTVAGIAIDRCLLLLQLCDDFLNLVGVPHGMQCPPRAAISKKCKSVRQKRQDGLVLFYKARLEVRQGCFALQFMAIESLVRKAAADDMGGLLDPDE
jgi:hypothetical protein